MKDQNQKSVLSAYCPKSPEGKLQLWFMGSSPEAVKELISAAYLDQDDGPRTPEEAWEMLTTMGWVIVHLQIKEMEEVLC